jgi:hypothetical protein
MFTAIVGIFVFLCFWLGGFDFTTRRPELGFLFFWYGFGLTLIYWGLEHEW